MLLYCVSFLLSSITWDTSVDLTFETCSSRRACLSSQTPTPIRRTIMKINTNNATKIGAEIDRAEGRATKRTITHEMIIDETKSIEKRLSTLLPKKDWKGLSFDCDPHAQSFPSAYKYTPESTSVTLERGASGWFVTSISRTVCSSPSNMIKPQNLTERQEQIMAFISQPRNF